MKKYRILPLAAAVLLASCSVQPPPGHEAPALTEESASHGEEISGGEEADLPAYVPRSGLLQCNFFDSDSFALWDSRAADYPCESPILCGTAPHHLTAGHMISGFFRAAAKSRQDVDTVVIIATSHYKGSCTFYTSHNDWDSPFGVVENNRDISDYFCSRLGAEADDDRLVTDHSASSHIPFVKHYFPNAKTACLLAAPTLDKDAPQKLAQALAEMPDADKCLFLFSIDFSHYLSAAEADMNDEITRLAVTEKDFGTIEGFGNDNVDSPLILSAYVRLSGLLGGSIREADNSNTCKVNNEPYDPVIYDEGVTSYFVFVTT